MEIEGISIEPAFEKRTHLLGDPFDPSQHWEPDESRSAGAELDIEERGSLRLRPA